MTSVAYRTASAKRAFGARYIAQTFERTHEDIAEVASSFLDPRPVLAGQKASPSELGRRRGLRARLVEILRGECRFRSLDRLRRHVDVD